MPCAHHGPACLVDSRSGCSSSVAPQPTLTERLLWARPRARMGGRIQPESSSPAVRERSRRGHRASQQGTRQSRLLAQGRAGWPLGVWGSARKLPGRGALRGGGWASHREGPAKALGCAGLLAGEHTPSGPARWSQSKLQANVLSRGLPSGNARGEAPA